MLIVQKDEKRVQIEQCSEKLEINGELFVKTDRNVLNYSND